MNEKSSVSYNGGIGFLGVLTIVLLILKVVGYLPNLAWMWVFAPIWIPWAIVLSIAVVALVIAAVVALLE